MLPGTSKVNNRKPYNGDRRALVLAFDVGTTFSGVSYAFLDPGEIPKIHGVTRYPGQEHVTGNTKIPSLLYYDRSGNVVAAGAEAESGQIADEAEDAGWYKVELFKLRLRPRRMELDMNGMRLTPLPPSKSSEDVFGDFLAYLFSCTRKFIEDTHAGGKKLWRAVEKDIHFVLSHPNGWEGAQQTRMRRAAISGGLIPNTDEGKARIRFVTEGEASMHACILSGLAHDVLASGNGFIVADAGGGTLDVSSYILRGTHPLQIEEVAPPDCVFSGAVFVSRRCRIFLEEKLRNSKYGSPDILEHITKRFDETTKRLFRDKRDHQYIQFGSPLDRDPDVGIRSGQLKLSGSEVAELFEPSIQAAVASIRRQIELSRGAVKAVWLVGGFAASPWLFSQLQQRLAPLGVTVNRPDSQTSKAVADGAIGFFCDHHVSARMSRYMYGVEYLREIDVNDQEHVTRSGRQLQLPSGPKYLPDAFDCILAKNVRVKESSVFTRKYYTEVTKLSTLSVFEIEIWCYRGGETIPKWIDRTSDQFGSLCFVRADLSRLSKSAEPKKGANGQTYWTVVFSIEIHFGLTEFKARMKWNEDGKVKYGPATIVFNEKGARSDEDDAYSVAGGDDAMPVSPRRPYGSLLNHTTREPSTTTRSSRHRERDRDRGMHRENSHRTPSLGAPSMSRSMSGQTDVASVETVTREPSPPPAAPPVSASVSSSMRGKTRSRGLGSTVPSVREPEPEPMPEREIGPSPPSMHSRAPSIMSPPSMHSRAPSASAPMSTHSRAPSTVIPPVYSRTPSVAPSPSMHSRAPSAAAPPSMHSHAPSAAAAPSVVHSRTPSAAPTVSPVTSRAPSAVRDPSPPVVSRAPSAAAATSPIASRVPSAAPAISPVASRAPSAAPAASPVPSRAPSSGSRPSVSRAPSSGGRVPTVSRQGSIRSGHGSRAPSQMPPLDEGDLYGPTEPDVSGSAADYFNSVPAPSDGLDATRTCSRSISPAPPGAAPAAEDQDNWEIPSVSVVPPSATEQKDEKKGFSWAGGWGTMFGANGKRAGDAAGPSAFTGNAPLAAFGTAEEPFIPPAPGGTSWDEPADHPLAPGGWEFDPPAPAEPPAPEPVVPEPEVTAPPISKTTSGKSTGGKGKKVKGILKNGSASSKAAEAEAKAKAKAEAEAREKAEAEERERAKAEAARTQAEAEEYERQQAEADARARAEDEERERQQAEAEHRAWEEAEMERKAREQAEAEQRTREEQERLEAEHRARIEREEAEAHARAEAERIEQEAREKEAAEARAKAKEEQAAAAVAATKAKADAEAAEAEAAKEKADAEAAAAQEQVQEQAEGEANGAGDAAGDFGPLESTPPAPQEDAVDEERVELEAAAEKAEKNFQKAEDEFNKAEVALAKAAKPPAKGKGKGKKATGPSPAEKSAERNLHVAKSALETAKQKLEKAKAALAAHAPEGVPAAEDTIQPAGDPQPEPEPAAPNSNVESNAGEKGKKEKRKKKKNAALDNDDEENEAEKAPATDNAPKESAPPISKQTSTASGKGKKGFSFADLSNDDDDENKGDENEGEEGKDGDGIADDLMGGGGGGLGWGGSGWGFSTSFGAGGDKSGSKTGSWL